jgi:hypothetical protein
MEHESRERHVSSSDSSQLRRATDFEREILRLEDRCYELLTKLAAASLTKSAIAARLDALREAETALVSQLSAARRTGKLDEIYCSALDQRMAALVFLCEKTRRQALRT